MLINNMYCMQYFYHAIISLKEAGLNKFRRAETMQYRHDYLIGSDYESCLGKIVQRFQAMN